MFPIGDDNRDRRHTPVVTYLLITANVLVFFYTLAQGANRDFFYANWGMIPDRILPVVPLPVEYRALTSAPLVTLLTSMFLHGGWLHIIGNMLFLYVFGDNVEDRMGPVRFLIFYLLAGLAGNAAHIAFNLGSLAPSVGASGAIAGVLGGYIVLRPTGGVRNIIWLFIIPIPVVLPAWLVIGYWFFTQALNGVGALTSNFQSGRTSDGVAYWAHIGGFIFGALAVKLFTVARDDHPGYGARLDVPTYDYRGRTR